jgi:hypothetical protein
MGSFDGSGQCPFRNRLDPPDDDMRNTLRFSPFSYGEDEHWIILFSKIEFLMEFDAQCVHGGQN